MTLKINMTTRWTQWGRGIAFLLLCGSLKASEVRLEFISSASNPQELHLFADRPNSLSLSVEAPLGSLVSLRADLSVIQGTMLVPLEKSLAVAKDLDFKKTTRQTILYTMNLPKIKGETKMRFSLFAQLKGASTWESVGNPMMITAYPRTLDGDFKKVVESLQGSGVTLAIAGESANLRAYFLKHQIRCVDLGMELPQAKAKGVCFLAEISTQAVGRLTSNPLLGTGILFLSPVDPSRLPGVYQTAGNSIWVVNLPLFQELESNPLSQKSLIQTIEMAALQAVDAKGKKNENEQ